MLPPGHLAAGYLITNLVIKILKPELSSGGFNNLLFLGTLFGAVPDSDFIYHLLHPRKKSFQLVDCQNKNSHRHHFTHAPLTWLIIGLIIFLIGSLFDNLFLKYVSVLLWLCSWSHFFLDSLEGGIRWLWPFSKKFSRIRKIIVLFENNDDKFLKRCAYFSKHYKKNLKLTFYLEISLIITATIVFFLNIF